MRVRVAPTGSLAWTALVNALPLTVCINLQRSPGIVIHKRLQRRSVADDVAG